MTGLVEPSVLQYPEVPTFAEDFSEPKYFPEEQGKAGKEDGVIDMLIDYWPLS